MHIQICDQTTVTNYRPETLQEIRNRLTSQNPAWLENEKRGFSNFHKERLIQHIGRTLRQEPEIDRAKALTLWTRGLEYWRQAHGQSLDVQTDVGGL